MFANNWEIIFRLLISTLAGGIIGYERELKGRDAGFRTHTLVCLGATIIALTQIETSEWLAGYVQDNGELANVLSSDVMRLTAQIVNGIGFLGAGTIIVSQRSVSGLTTAASIWAVAGLGISLGMGYYLIGGVSTILILIILRYVNTAFRIERTKRLVVRYKNYEKTHQFLQASFKDYQIDIISTEFSIKYGEDGEAVSEDIFKCLLPRDIDLQNFIHKLGQHPDILQIHTVKAE